jgi:hypothetical protein
MKEIKKPSPVGLTVRFIVGILITLVIFGTFFYLKYNYPNFNNWCVKLGIHTNTISAFLTALAFVGFLIISQYQARCNHITELKMLAEKERNKQETEIERQRDRKIQHDSLWLTMQIARLNTFTNSPPSAENEYCRKAVLKEIEDYWAKFSTWLNEKPTVN